MSIVYRLYPELEKADSGKHIPYDGPKLILFCAWTDASDKNIQKFIDGYQALYPLSPILLVKTTSADYFSTPSGLVRRAKPAVEMIKNVLWSESQLNGGLLVHVLSNGGSGHLNCIARRFRLETGMPLPVNALILDSCPTMGTFLPLLKSLSMPLPRPFFIFYPLQALVAMGILFFFLVPRWLGMLNIADRTFIELNGRRTDDQELFREEAIRTYIYTESDDLCPFESIESHWQTAKERGFLVKTERWENSGHVAHMKNDPERYWRVVDETWKQRA